MIIRWTPPNFSKEFGLQAVYARRGIDYYTNTKVYPHNGDMTLAGLKVNIDEQVQDGVIKARCRRRSSISL